MKTPSGGTARSTIQREHFIIGHIEAVISKQQRGRGALAVVGVRQVRVALPARVRAVREAQVRAGAENRAAPDGGREGGERERERERERGGGQG